MSHAHSHNSAAAARTRSVRQPTTLARGISLAIVRSTGMRVRASRAARVSSPQKPAAAEALAHFAAAIMNR